MIGRQEKSDGVGHMPPRPSPAAVREALTDIAARRRRAEDPALDQLSDQPWEVLDHLARHPALRPDDTAAEGRDAFVLLAELRWQLVEHEYRHLERVDQLPTAVRPANATVDAWLGNGLGRQSVRDRRDRDAALLQRGPGHDEHDLREARAAARRHEHQAAAEDARLAERADELHSLRGRLLHAATSRGDIDGDVRDWLAELVRDHHEHDCNRQALAVLALTAAAVLAAHPGVDHDPLLLEFCVAIRRLREDVRTDS